MNLNHQSRKSLPLNQFSDLSQFTQPKQLEGKRGQVPSRKDLLQWTKCIMLILFSLSPKGFTAIYQGDYILGKGK